MANKQGDFIWYELLTSDADAATAFYASIFGWTLNDTNQQDTDYRIIAAAEGEMDMGPMGPYECLRRADVEGLFAGVMTKTKEMLVSLWSFYFRVADVDDAVRRTRAGGGRIIVDPMEIPGGEFSASAVDPQGALFAFVGPRK